MKSGNAGVQGGDVWISTPLLWTVDVRPRPIKGLRGFTKGLFDALMLVSGERDVRVGSFGVLLRLGLVGVEGWRMWFPEGAGGGELLQESDNKEESEEEKLLPSDQSSFLVRPEPQQPRGRLMEGGQTGQ